MNSLLNGADGAAMGAFIVSYILSMMVSMGIAALVLVSRWHVFKKLGMPGWKGLIPFYSDFVLFKLLWKTKPFWVQVIAAGVYYVVSIILTIVMTAVLVSNADTASEEKMLALLGIFAVIFALLTAALMVIAFIIDYKLYYRLSKAFGKGAGFAAGLTFLSPIFFPILAFGKAQRVE